LSRLPLHLAEAPEAGVPPALLETLGLDARSASDPGSFLLLAGDEAIGVASIGGKDEAWFGALAVRPDMRGRGYGAEAAGLLLNRLRREGVRTVRALAPEGNGLAVYFWFRMGFRPEKATERGLVLRQDLGETTGG
jgi:GNAT superfamily N-acetyltransferase